VCSPNFRSSCDRSSRSKKEQECFEARRKRSVGKVEFKYNSGFASPIEGKLFEAIGSGGLPDVT
jgi:hypothetical protein